MNQGSGPLFPVGPSRLGADQLAARLPGLWSALEGFGAALEASRLVRACVHIVDGLEPALACIQHPAAGLACAGCSNHHFGRHAAYSCARCGEVALLVVPLAFAANGFFSIVEPRGRSRVLADRITVAGMALCPTCAAVLDETPSAPVAR